MSSTLIKIGVGVAALLFLPALVVGGGFILAGVAAFVVIVALIAGREGLDVYKKKRIAAKGQRNGQDQDVNRLLGSIGIDDETGFSRGDKRE